MTTDDLRGVPAVEFIAAEYGITPDQVRRTTDDLDAIRARLEQVEADRDRWKHAYDMADPLLTERDRLAAENTKLPSLLAYARQSPHAYAATLDRLQYLVDVANEWRPVVSRDEGECFPAVVVDDLIENLRTALEGTDS